MDLGQGGPVDGDKPIEIAVNAVGLAPGGGLTYLLNQATEFEKLMESVRLTYFVAPRCRDAMLEVVPRERLRVPFPKAPRYTRRIYWEQVVLPRLLVQEGFDLLYSAGGFASFLSPVPQLLLDANPLHHATVKDIGAGPLVLRARFERMAAKASARRAQTVVYPSHSFTDAMASVGFPAPTCVIPSGVSIDWPSLEGFSGFNLDCDHCARSPFVLAVHTWYKHKQLEWLARVWAQDPRLNVRHRVIVGSPVDKRGRRLRKFFDKPEIAGVVHTLEGLPRAAVARLYQRAHMYVSAAVLEAFPLTPFEAMSFGVPCTLSDIPPHREVAGPAAIYFRSGDVNSLVDALEEAEVRNGEYSQLAMEAPKSSWTSNVELLKHQFEVLVGRASSHRGTPQIELDGDREALGSHL